ncbi:hypothetical protein COE67_04360 [Priestia megaterium]|uniref:hypothetical protein n=1 Tax=Priestia megaterium TaxID=1404 RepID=UPI000BFBB9E4|nr:hypothetical protein [Priestia megaterium]MBZ5479416.1 hypothetical protein [Bacillus sp. T_4]PGX44184.1 hypothetical protein COE67_04360 [Priestia megaterium]UYO26328.1 hypothetical protein LDP77_05310 [Bacillus sp. T_4]WPL42981.1 hypothetical protein QY062_21465 [Priestia megaterium]
MKKRTKTIIAVIAGAAILIGGIWMINESRYPNVPAFDDHFTREFLNKDKKVDDGFYEFKSKTGQYTMWFPEEYQLLHENEQQYVRDGDFYERWKASSVKNKEENQLNYLQVKLSESNPDDESIYVESLFKDEFGVNNPQKWETANTRIYFDTGYLYFKGTEEHVIYDKNKHAPNTYIAYVADKNSSRVIELWFDDSLNNQVGRESDKKDWFVKVLNSIHFKEGKKHE